MSTNQGKDREYSKTKDPVGKNSPSESSHGHSSNSTQQKGQNKGTNQTREDKSKKSFTHQSK